MHLLIGLLCTFSRFGESGFGESGFGESGFGESGLNLDVLVVHICILSSSVLKIPNSSRVRLVIIDYDKTVLGYIHFHYSRFHFM